MLQHHRLLVCLTVLLGCCAVPESVIGQVAPAARVRTVAAPARNGTHLYTVMGHVRDQRTFELATASPSLVQVVETFARGLSETASSNIRIVRNGRVIHTFYRKDSTERLMPGDLVIVDGRRAGGTVFRGSRSNADDSGQLVRIGLLGLLPYPIILNHDPAAGPTPSRKPTVHLIARQLGQADAAAISARLIVPRRFAQLDASSALPDCSVVIFDPATIDVSRLPSNLPVPYRPGPPSPPDAGRSVVVPPAQTGRMPNPRPLVQVPQPGVATVPRSPRAESGYRPPVPGPLPGTSPDAPVRSSEPARRAAEEHVRDLLTSPGSVPVEPLIDSRGSSRDGADRSEPGRVHIDESVGRADRARSDGSSVVQVPDSARPSELAGKPFQSFPDESVSEDSLNGPQGFDVSGEPSPDRRELPLMPANQSAGQTGDSQEFTAGDPPSAAVTDADGRNEEYDGDAVTSEQSGRTPVSGVDGHNSQVARNTDTENFDAGEVQVPQQEAAFPTDAGMPFPTAMDSVKNTASETHAAAALVASIPSEPVVEAARGTARFLPDVTDSSVSPIVSASQKGRVTPRVPDPSNWPLIAALTIGGLGVFSLLLLMVVVAWKKPDAVPPADPGARGWLDRILQNDLPIEEVAAELPKGMRIFGQVAPIHRLDAAHGSVPRPHFSGAGRTVNSGAGPQSASPAVDQSVKAPDIDTGNAEVSSGPVARAEHTQSAGGLIPDGDRDSRESRHSRTVGTQTAVAAESVEPLSTAGGSLATADSPQETGRSAQGRSRDIPPVPSSAGFALDIARLPAVENGEADGGFPGKAGDIRVDQNDDRTSSRTGPVLRIDRGHGLKSRRRVVQDGVAAAGPAESRTSPAVHQEAVVRHAAPGRQNVPSEAVGSRSGAAEITQSELRKRQLAGALPVSVESGPAAPEEANVMPSAGDVQEPSGGGRNELPPGDPVVTIKPARSVEEGSDLLDRILSSVQQEKRGDR